MDHGKRRGAYRVSGEADQIDLGHEPPLSVDGETQQSRRSPPRLGAVVQRHHSDRSLRRGSHGRRRFRVARRPEQFRDRSGARAARAPSSHRRPLRAPRARPTGCRRRANPTASAGSSATPRPAASATARSCASAPFVRVAGNLALSTSELSANIPAFNPQKMLLAEIRCPSGAGRRRLAATPRSMPKSPSSPPIWPACCRARRSRRCCPIDDVLARVRDAANWTGTAAVRGRWRRTCRATRDWPMRRKALPDPYAGFEARIAPENVTLLPKTTARDHRRHGLDRAHRQHRAKANPSPRCCAISAPRPDDIKAITGVLGARGRDGGVREHQKLRVLLAPTERPQTHAADPRRDRQRHQHRGRGRAVRSRPLRLRRHPQHGDRNRAGARTAAAGERRTTAGACGSIRASTRPRCATRCRAR